MEGLLSLEIYPWLIPVLIFLARIVDVSIGTVRIIFISRGMRLLAPLFGFFEVLIWLLAIGQIMRNLTDVVAYLAYAGGFAMGTFVGIYIENKLSIGVVLVRIITQKDASELIEWLQSENYGVTTIDAQGAKGQVKIIFTIIKRYDIRKIAGMVQRFNPRAFYSIADVRSVSEGVFPPPRSQDKRDYLRLLRRHRKGK